MKIDLVDVKAQYAPLEPEFRAAFERVLQSGRFIFGQCQVLRGGGLLAVGALAHDVFRDQARRVDTGRADGGRIATCGLARRGTG